MTDKTPQSLRTQVIESMNSQARSMGWADRSYATNADMFDQAIMPVLRKAMDAGDLIVGRNTKATPVPIAVMQWLEAVCGHVEMIQANESTISKRKALDIIYQFGNQAQRAIHEAQFYNEHIINKDS